jgi:hypothetical protein
MRAKALETERRLEFGGIRRTFGWHVWIEPAEQQSLVVGSICKCTARSMIKTNKSFDFSTRICLALIVGVVCGGRGLYSKKKAAVKEEVIVCVDCWRVSLSWPEVENCSTCHLMFQASVKHRFATFPVKLYNEKPQSESGLESQTWFARTGDVVLLHSVTFQSQV